MKKFFAVLMACIIAVPTFSYTTLESSIADYLAQKNIIQDHRSEVSKYRLNDKISRQEVVALAMKISGMTANAPCRGYFADVGSKSGWVCPAVESAADQGFISRSNKNFRPKAFITKAEALSILLKAGDIPVSYTSSSLYSSHVPQWQIDVIETADANGILSVHVDGASPDQVFQPNKIATRAEVFGFAYQVLVYNEDDTSSDEIESDAEMKGIFQDNGNGSATYLSAPRDFLITLPSDTIRDLTEEDVSSDGSGSVTGVSGIVDVNGSQILFAVGRDQCPGQCTPQFIQKVIQDFQQSAINEGANISDLGNMLYSMRDSELSGYAKIVPSATAIYTVLVVTDIQHSNENNATMMQMLSSFRNR